MSLGYIIRESKDLSTANTSQDMAGYNNYY